MERLDKSSVRCCARRTIALALIWLAAIGLAAALDQSVAQWVRDSGTERWVHTHTVIARIAKAPGVYYFTLVLAAGVCALHSLRWRAAIFLSMTGITGLLNSLLKWIVGRTRPFKLEDQLLHGVSQPAPFILQPFRRGWAGLFHEKNLSFASGHATVAFATAAGLAILFPRWRWAFYAVAIVVAIERVVENAHYLSDTVAAAGLSMAVVHLIGRIGRPLFQDRLADKAAYD
jgi:undecaprenyl-diphosphatase